MDWLLTRFPVWVPCVVFALLALVCFLDSVRVRRKMQIDNSSDNDLIGEGFLSNKLGDGNATCRSWVQFGSVTQRAGANVRPLLKEAAKNIEDMEYDKALSCIEHALKVTERENDE